MNCKNLISRLDSIHRQGDLVQAGVVEFPDTIRERVSGMQDGLLRATPEKQLEQPDN